MGAIVIGTFLELLAWLAVASHFPSLTWPLLLLLGVTVAGAIAIRAGATRGGAWTVIGASLPFLPLGLVPMAGAIEELNAADAEPALAGRQSLQVFAAVVPSAAAGALLLLAGMVLFMPLAVPGVLFITVAAWSAKHARVELFADRLVMIPVLGRRREIGFDELRRVQESLSRLRITYQDGARSRVTSLSLRGLSTADRLELSQRLNRLVDENRPRAAA
jgi:hypothetical protein